MENDLNDIIDDFNNDESNSIYTITSEMDGNTNNSDKIEITGFKKDEDCLFLNEKSETECEDYSDIESSIIDKTYFTKEDLNDKNSNVIKLFYTFDILIFTDDLRIKVASKTGCFCFFKNSNKYVNPSEFPGILFLSFSSINLIKKKISNHNSNILNSDSEIHEKKYKYQICFDEGDIYKNMVYKKLQIQDKLLFVPMSKYQLKLTEYRLRGFCQIMEELGAIEIEIEFNNGNLDSKKNKIEIKSSDYAYIAGSLGFSASNIDSENKKITYKLIYPKNNTFILNSKIISKKIASNKYIISKKNFDSNLELQYIVESRCKHFITNYATVFTLDNTISYDYKLMGKLEEYKFNLGFETSNEIMKNLKLSINTSVKFCDQKDSYKNLLGDNVSWDSIGFNYLLGSLKEESFKDEGIYKIIFFTHKYIDKVIYQKNRENYYNIKKIYKIMNKEFSFDEYRDLLLSHFSVKSHWLHFLNFIDILLFKSVSYDKLGFLILMSQTELSPFKKNQKIINFIRHISTQESVEDEFWEMLEPNNYYLAINKLSKEYNILEEFNWFNLKKLIYDLKKYKPNNLLDLNNELSYKELYQNFILGHHNLQFEKNIKPFLMKYINNNFIDRLKKLSLNLSPIIFELIKTRHILYYNINTEEKLNNLIETKINFIEEGDSLIEDLNEEIKNHDIKDVWNSDSDIYKKITKYISNENFKEKYPNINRKINFILPNLSDLDKIDKFCGKCCLNKNLKIFCESIVKKILIFDHKFNVNNIDLNRYGYNSLLLYIKNTGESKIKLNFFINLCNFIVKEKSRIGNNNLIKLESLDEDIKEKIENNNDYESMVNLSCEFLNSKFNLNIEKEFNRLIKT